MITQYFHSGGYAEFKDDGGLLIGGKGEAMLSAKDFAQLMPLAIHVYHMSNREFGCGPMPMGGNAIKPAGKKCGRPKKVTNAKPGRPRKA